jgi:hypothetical protein
MAAPRLAARAAELPGQQGRGVLRIPHLPAGHGDVASPPLADCIRPYGAPRDPYPPLTPPASLPSYSIPSGCSRAQYHFLPEAVLFFQGDGVLGGDGFERKASAFSAMLHAQLLKPPWRFHDAWRSVNDRERQTARPRAPSNTLKYPQIPSNAPRPHRRVHMRNIRACT